MRKDKTIKELPPENARIEQIIRHFSKGNVRAFQETLMGISHQVLNRIFNIDGRSDKYPGVSSDIIAAIVKRYPEVNPDWILTGNGQMLKRGPAALDIQPHDNERFTADQLFHMYMKAMERQDGIMETQMVLLSDIKKEMAKETTLAGMEANLKRTMAAALTVSKGQEDGMKEIRDLFLQVRAQKKAPSRGAGKGRGRIDGGFEKTGKRPASSR